MKNKWWQGQAIELFYKDRKNLVDIEAITGITRKTIAAFLHNENPTAFEAEKNKRKEDTKERTKLKNKEWAENNREKVVQAVANWQAVHPEKVEEYKITSNARRLGMTPDDYKIYVFQRASLKDELRQQHENDVMAMSSHGMPKTISNSELTYYRSAYKQTKSGNYKRLEVTRDGAAVPKTLPRVIPKRL